jgi:hypothetical protein
MDTNKVIIQKCFLRLRELYKGIVNLWICFMNPWICIILWITNPDLKRFGLYRESQIRT